MRNGLTGLGLIARLARAAGLGVLLDATVDLLDRIFMKLDLPPLTVRTRGIVLRGFLRHRSFMAGLLKEYESFPSDLFTECVMPGTVVIDAGAHIGFYSFLAAQKLDASGQVYAFEPDPYNACALKHNVRRSRHGHRIRVVEAALSCQTGRQVFFSSRSTIGGSLAKRTDTGRLRKINVTITSLDSFFYPQRPESLVIKLDIEGNEPRALRGMRDSVRRANSVSLLVEANSSALVSAGESIETLIEDLEANHLEACWIDEERRVLTSLEDVPFISKGNLFCTKKQK
jgi:FkbM family methyltransferase